MKIDRQKVYEKFEGHCAYCGREIKFKEMQVDHIKPKYFVENGQRWNDLSLEVDSFDNLNPSCRMCNYYKSSCTLDDFRKLISTIRERICDKFIVRVGMAYGIIEVKDWDGLFYFEHVMIDNDMNYDDDDYQDDLVEDSWDH